eukprot:TRINITY_DN9932_c0_g1_i1.p1 TRINITY_DN9932_c0_g1~~TRINITY_DN9932_c0_g1_i1.p1  ORF type:complete len:764 (+),score=206.71 TRINITY_DN9932_c0_g1_i1:295-2292(+)
MAFLHAADPPVLHGDLKCANLLLDSNLRVKISDFGLSQLSSTAGVGTPIYMAPELLNGNGMTAASDVYAFSMVMAEVFNRQPPYADLDTSLATILERVGDVHSQPLLRPQVPSFGIPDDVYELMQQAWSPLAKDRPAFSDMIPVFDNLKVSSVGKSLFKRSKDRKLQKRLLNDCFPPHIAEALKNGEKIKPEKRDITTLFFSDIVGFTNISATLSPELVSDMLDRLYTAFDALVDEHDLFKVETIGDAYFCAANLVKDQQDHTIRIAKFSLAAMKAAQNTLINLNDPDAGYVNLRVGFHCGPVVTNVVGKRNARFCLFGDTVNTASRMESNSIKNCIHMSEAAAVELQQQCALLDNGIGRQLRCRGEMEIKGKGKMRTYWLVPAHEIRKYDKEHDRIALGADVQAAGQRRKSIVPSPPATKGSRSLLAPLSEEQDGSNASSPSASKPGSGRPSMTKRTSSGFLSGLKRKGSHSNRGSKASLGRVSHGSKTSLRSADMMPAMPTIPAMNLPGLDLGGDSIKESSTDEGIARTANATPMALGERCGSDPVEMMPTSKLAETAVTVMPGKAEMNDLDLDSLQDSTAVNVDVDDIQAGCVMPGLVELSPSSHGESVSDSEDEDAVGQANDYEVRIKMEPASSAGSGRAAAAGSATLEDLYASDHRVTLL